MPDKVKEKEVTHIQVWKDTRDIIKGIAKTEGVSMKKMIDTWAKKHRIRS